MAMVVVDNNSLQADSQPKSGRVNSRNDHGHDDGTINRPGITVIIIFFYPR